MISKGITKQIKNFSNDYFIIAHTAVLRRVK